MKIEDGCNFFDITCTATIPTCTAVISYTTVNGVSSGFGVGSVQNTFRCTVNGQLTAEFDKPTDVVSEVFCGQQC
ncbi:unnamed protein product [Caenorhabditis auriculariae]|uniref:DUF281 domain-containing protein n=1 Tax=Caenorhabditis auriculariae TaxID=2777116 RepID=A0A8S1HCE6_9PELO|nr:unnamed protein product [Caenorhabditis auriculariae]